MIQASPNDIRSFLAWVWGGVLIVGGALYWAITTGVLSYTGSPLPIIAGGSAAISLPFLGRFAVKREQWSLLTAWIFLALGGIFATLFFTPRNPQLVLAAFLIAIAIPLSAAYSIDRARWWLLLAGYVAVALSALIVLTAFHAPIEALGGTVVLAIALPFWGTVLLNPKARWAMIPAAVLSVAAVIVLVFFVILEPGTAAYYIVLNGTLATVFFALYYVLRWLDWAPWLGTGFTGAAVLSYWYPSPANWALIALALGGYIVYRQISGARVAAKANIAAAPQVAAQPATRPPASAPAASSASAAPSATVASTPPSAALPPEPPAPKGPPPGIEFIPLDPLKGRKKDGD
jgi:hypothetical protein